MAHGGGGGAERVQLPVVVYVTSTVNGKKGGVRLDDVGLHGSAFADGNENRMPLGRRGGELCSDLTCECRCADSVAVVHIAHNPPLKRHGSAQSTAMD
ncbi:unnamed protein product [Arctogadus glacialis]